ncbi:MAG: M2 family metallopeptidase [Planctomycetes bacterium]|nr:M2 family metallopeptidase [Planctomycetota bacterium]MBI3847076.1 M2 family metallopeptidase [Planctomycetota bacterium]
MRALTQIAIVTGILAGAGCQSTAPSASSPSKDGSMNTTCRTFLDKLTEKIRPVERQSNLAWWEANTTGDDAAFARQVEFANQLDAIYADPTAFSEIKRFRDSKQVTDPTLTRELDVFYFAFLGKQVDPSLLAKMNERSTEVEKKFNAYRGNVDGKEMSDNEIREVLKSSTDNDLRRKAWEASKGVGPVLLADLRELVKLRNESARKLGFENFYVMSLALNEQSEKQVLDLFDDLDRLTRKPFLDAKAEVDQRLAKRYGVDVADLRPWHYQDPFFQESPKVYDCDLDAIDAKVDVLATCRDFYAGIGLPIADVIQRSDFYEKPKKNPHAFCTNIDRGSDVRVLGNIKPNDYWLETMLHELGHSVYEKGFGSSLPFALRTPSHTLTTEGIAMMFGRLSKSAPWMHAAIGMSDADAQAIGPEAWKMLRFNELVFSRWCQVMLHFERELYRNPDGDLNKLWWDLVESYQGVKRPEGRDAPDFAAKIHIVSAPVYYHNYMMGALFASQVHRTIARDVLHQDERACVYVGDPRVGRYLTDRVFAPGNLYSWNELTKYATGQPLTPDAFAAQFVQASN